MFNEDVLFIWMPHAGRLAATVHVLTIFAESGVYISPSTPSSMIVLIWTITLTEFLSPAVRLQCAYEVKGNISRTNICTVLIKVREVLDAEQEQVLAKLYTQSSPYRSSCILADRSDCTEGF